MNNMRLLIPATGLLLVVCLLLVSCGQPEPDDGSYFPLPGGEMDVVRSEVHSFMVDTVLTGLNRPWSMEFLPGNKVLITERGGNIQLAINGQLQEEPLAGNVPDGLRDIALHPDYKKNGWVYMSYYQEPEGDEAGYAVLMRGRLTENGNRLTDQEILYRAGPFDGGGFWTGSRIAFDRDNYLYFLVPIRGSRMNAQDLLHHSGKTMRFYDDGTIPEDNPFVGRDDALPEIFTWGHREHQGLAVHPETGELWSTEHGEFGGDELNILKSGRNYGWPLASYSLEYTDRTPVSPDTLLDGTEPPVHHWTPSIVPSGMTFVYSDLYPGWNGNILIASLTHRVPVDSPPRLLHRSVIENDRVVHDEGLIEMVGRTRSVKVAPDGYIYFITEDTGHMLRLIPVE